jgi:hypothetical protein
MQTKEIFETITKNIKALPPCYEKVYILNLYAEFLFAENPNSIKANSKINFLKIAILEESKKIESKIQNYESRRSYLICPNI